MTREEMHLGRQTPLEDPRRQRVFYEIHPDLSLQVERAPDTGFEIALHIEVEEYRPPSHPQSREAYSVLMGLADTLIQRVKSHAPYGLEMPASYYTLHPAEDRNHPRMALTVSLVFFDGGPWKRLEEPGLLTQLRTELALLGIPRRKCCFGGCECH